jgi:hypothetical protein
MRKKFIGSAFALFVCAAVWRRCALAAGSGNYASERNEEAMILTPDDGGTQTVTIEK